MGRELITTHILSSRPHSYKNANSFRVGILARKINLTEESVFVYI
jgi:hypothetical protein